MHASFKRRSIHWTLPRRRAFTSATFTPSTTLARAMPDCMPCLWTCAGRMRIPQVPAWSPCRHWKPRCSSSDWHPDKRDSSSKFIRVLASVWAHNRPNQNALVRSLRGGHMSRLRLVLLLGLTLLLNSFSFGVVRNDDRDRDRDYKKHHRHHQKHKKHGRFHERDARWM